ncbi:MAG: DUF2157 domain-containing protein [Pseudomonadota bacterium]
MLRHVKWLLPEVDQWVEAGIIDLAQAEAIRTRYPPTDETTSWGRIIFLAMGAVLFGLGVILLIAYNWEEMHKAVKLGLIGLSLTSAHVLGMWFRRPESRFRTVGEALHLLGTMLFGAGIWLVAQIYHLDEHYPNAFLVWGVGALALGWTLPSVPQAILGAVILTLWNGFEVLSFGQVNHLASPLIFFGVLPLAWAFQSRVLLATGVVSFLITLAITCLGISDDLIVPILFFCACMLLSASLLVREKGLFPGSAGIFSFLGHLPYLAILYVLSFPSAAPGLLGVDFNNRASLVYFTLFALAAAALWLITLWPPSKIRDRLSESFRIDLLAVPVILIIMIGLIVLRLTGHKAWPTAGLFNLVFLFHSIVFISHGCRTVNIRLAATGCLLLSLLAATRYADLFQSLIMRAVIFLVIGSGLFLVGAYYSKAKKKAREGAS